LFKRLGRKKGKTSLWQNACFIIEGCCVPDFLNKEIPLAGMIQWETDLNKALVRAGSEEKSVLLFFHNAA